MRAHQNRRARRKQQKACNTIIFRQQQDECRDISIFSNALYRHHIFCFPHLTCLRCRPLGKSDDFSGSGLTGSATAIKSSFTAVRVVLLAHEESSTGIMLVNGGCGLEEICAADETSLRDETGGLVRTPLSRGKRLCSVSQASRSDRIWWKVSRTAAETRCVRCKCTESPPERQDVSTTRPAGCAWPCNILTTRSMSYNNKSMRS